MRAWLDVTRNSVVKFQRVWVYSCLKAKIKKIWPNITIVPVENSAFKLPRSLLTSGYSTKGHLIFCEKLYSVYAMKYQGYLIGLCGKIVDINKYEAC